jgi:hypothetical protein
MMGRIFPRQFDNDFRGYAIAIWILIPVVIMKMLQSLNAMDLNPWIRLRTIQETADRLPLDKFEPAAVDIMLLKAMTWGLGHFLLTSLGAIALIRYRAMIPLVYLLLIADQAGRKLIVWLNPVARTGETTLMLEIGLNATLAAMVVGFLFALATPKKKRLMEVG